MTTTLPRRPLGTTGLSVSILGLGAGHLGGAEPEREIEELLHEALDRGVNLIDTAPSYGCSEERIGRLIGHRHRRGEFVLSTKGGYGVPGVPDWTAAALTQGIDLALRRLRCERLDLFHLHSCPVDLLRRDDLLEALRLARAAGKIAVAAYSGENAALWQAVTGGEFGCVQASVNLCDQRLLDELVPQAVARGLGVIGKRPLANVAWTHPQRPVGQYAEVYWERLQALRPALPLAHGQELEIALRFAAYSPGVSSIIAGTRSVAHLRRNLEIVLRGPLPPEQYEAIRGAFRGVGAQWEGQI